MPLSAAHKAKIAASLRAYHAKCRACHAKAKTNKYATVRAKPARKYPKSKAATALAKSVRQGPLKRLRRAGTKAPAKKKKKAPRRVALTSVKAPVRRVSRFMEPQQAGEFGRSLTAGQRYMDGRVRKIGKKAKKLKGRDAAPEWAFSARWR